MDGEVGWGEAMHFGNAEEKGVGEQARSVGEGALVRLRGGGVEPSRGKPLKGAGGGAGDGVDRGDGAPVRAGRPNRKNTEEGEVGP